MITKLNHESTDELWGKYQKLFDRAWKALIEEGKAPTDIDGFTNISEYLTQIATLTNIDPVYLMLPLDEATFNIDANSRTITPPSEFLKCSGVKNDEYCEIITFKIDRYFDYKDLKDADILVQWINGNGQEGISRIVLKDYDTYKDEGMICFGWPLTSQITAAAGDLKFAVRFYNTITENGQKRYSYIFNTIPTTIPIKDTLDIDISKEDVIVHGDDDTLFKKFIKNSPNAYYGIPTPVRWDLHPPETSSIAANDTQTIVVRAATNDKNDLIYNWYRRPINSQTSFLIENNELYTQKFVYERYNPETWPEERPADLIGLVLYKKVSEEGEEDVFTPTPIWPKDRPTAEQDYLYLQNAALIFNEDDSEEKANITGSYFAEALNVRYDGEGKVVNQASSVSEECLFKAPGELSLKKDFPAFVFYPEVKQLEFALNADQGQPKRTYEFYKNGSKVNETWLEGDEFKYNLPEEVPYGTYKVKATSTLNRFSASLESTECQVCAHPIVPVGQATVKGSDGTAILAQASATEDLYSVYYNSDSDTTICILDVNLSTVAGGTNYDVGTLTYDWYVSKEDGGDDYEHIVTGGTGYGNIISSKTTDPTLKIRTGHVTAGDANIYTYKCVVTNTIQNESELREFFFVIR